MKFTAVIYTYNPDIDELKRTITFAVKLFDEIILIDDCSDTYVPKFRGIRMYRNMDHMGIVASKTLGIERASSNAVVFIKDNQHIDAYDVKEARKILKEFENAAT